MKNMDDFSKWLLTISSIPIIGLLILIAQEKEQNYNVKMANAGLEQCKPHWMSNQIIWVKSCKDINKE